MARVSNRIDSKSSVPAAKNTPAAPANSVASPRKENWLRGGRCQPAARIAPRHNARRHLGSGFLHGVGRHVPPVTPGGNPAWGYPRCCRQDQSRSGQDQIRSELLGLVQSSGQWNGWGTARFVERGAGQTRPAPGWKELGTWPTSQLLHLSLLFRYLSSTFFVFSSPLPHPMHRPYALEIAIAAPATPPGILLAVQPNFLYLGLNGPLSRPYAG